MIRWWHKFFRKVPLIAIHPARPDMKYNMDHWHIITIFGFELAILRLNN